MKGIFILSHHKTPGAFVDREFPSGICAQSGFGPDEENRIYFFNRMRDSKPNYVFVKVKGQQIGSYFSGFDPVICTGEPNQCVCVIFEEGENPTIWEEGIRQITMELLPVLAQMRTEDGPISLGLSKDPKYTEFDRLLAEKFHALQKGEPILKSHSVTIPSEAISEQKQKSAELRPEISSSEFSDQNHPSLKYLEVSITENEEQSFETALKTASAIPDNASHELQQKLSSMAQENGTRPEQSTIGPLESQLKQSQEQISEESINKINLLSAQLTEANSKAKEMWVSLSQREAQSKAKEQEITALKAEMVELKENLQKSQEKNTDLEVPSRIHAEIDDLRSQLNTAKTQIVEQKEQLQIEQQKSTSAEIPVEMQVEIDNLRSQLITAKAQNMEQKEQLQIALQKNASSEVPSRIHAEIEDLRTQLITAKKTIKVQRRDIVNLKNLLDLS
ncbi:MAG: hypothetical protein ACTSWW_11960 [Promethearchaeota archaeon]